jgi:hypothetical protein
MMGRPPPNPAAGGWVAGAGVVHDAAGLLETARGHYWKFRDGKACFVRSSEDTVQVAAALTP